MTESPTRATTTRQTRNSRVVGVDVARGIALLAMMAVHVFGNFTSAGTPTAAQAIAGGRSATLFVFVAGVSLAFLTGGRRLLHGHERTAAAAGIVVRAVIVGFVGLVLAHLGSGVDIILTQYALMFLIAITLVGLPSRVVAAIALTFALLGPVLIVATADTGIPYAGEAVDPGFGTAVFEPIAFVVLLLITGWYPVVTFMAYLCAGLAVGRLDLSSRQVALRLLGGGLALALLARLGSALLLYPLGGLDRLIAVSDGLDPGVPAAQQLLWEPERSSSWWYLALASPHSNTQFDLAHTAGSAMAILGAVLLVTRLPVVARVLGPVADAGSMTLTLYSAHVVLLATGVLQGRQPVLYAVMVVASLVFAVAWRRRFGQGPMERPMATCAGWARRAVARRLEQGVDDQCGCGAATR